MSDPFRELGLDRSASADDVRRARRQLSKRVHPDAGGQAADMQALNAAAAAALALIAGVVRHTSSSGESRVDDASVDSGVQRSTDWDRDWSGQRRDTPSFTVEELPVKTFEALLLVAAELGEIEDDDPPYGLTVLLSGPLACWCRLDVVPDAGASTVSVSIDRADGALLPPIDTVRNAWIDRMNALDWSGF